MNWGTEERRPGGSWCGASQTVDTVEVKYNVALAQNEYNQRANAWGVALGATPLYLVAHELGHVYYQQYLVGSNPYSASASADLAIRFENAARRPGAQRPLGTE